LKRLLESGGVLGLEESLDGICIGVGGEAARAYRKRKEVSSKTDREGEKETHPLNAPAATPPRVIVPLYCCSSIGQACWKRPQTILLETGLAASPCKKARRRKNQSGYIGKEEKGRGNAHQGSAATSPAAPPHSSTSQRSSSTAQNPSFRSIQQAPRSGGSASAGWRRFAQRWHTLERHRGAPSPR
jgi:hypothetical protein